MDTTLRNRGWTLWAQGGECYLERGNDRVMASALIDDHAEGLPQGGEKVFIALYPTPLGSHVMSLFGGYAQAMEPTATVEVSANDFLDLSADEWYERLVQAVGA
jgi:hypothetical protein